jgi:hypothetical protein
VPFSASSFGRGSAVHGLFRLEICGCGRTFRRVYERAGPWRCPILNTSSETDFAAATRGEPFAKEPGLNALSPTVREDDPTRILRTIRSPSGSNRDLSCVAINHSTVVRAGNLVVLASQIWLVGFHGLRGVTSGVRLLRLWRLVRAQEVSPFRPLRSGAVGVEALHGGDERRWLTQAKNPMATF